MDDLEAQANDMKQLEWELHEIFTELEEGSMLTMTQIDTLRYACGLPPIRRPNPVLSSIFKDYGNVFGGEK